MSRRSLIAPKSRSTIMWSIASATVHYNQSSSQLEIDVMLSAITE